MKRILQIRSSLLYAFKTKGQSPVKISVDKIPDNWEQFPDSDDRWISVGLPESENASACMYFIKKGNKFPGHFHESSTELLMVMNRSGKIKYYTPTDNGILHYGQSKHFEIKEHHYIEASEDTMIFCIWKPKFSKGWEGEFPEGSK